MTYARCRLWLGITGVGLWTLLSAFLLGSNTLQTLMPHCCMISCWQQTQLLLAWLGFYILIQTPLDWLGGYVLPKRFGRQPLSFAQYGLRWFWGVLLQSLILFGFGLFLWKSGQTYGPWGAIGAFVLSQLLLIVLQPGLMVLIGCLQKGESLPELETQLKARLQQRIRTAVIDHHDIGYTGFTGGFGGIKLGLPKHWVQTFSAEALYLIALRRALLMDSGAWFWGWAGAVMFNLCGFLLALWFAGWQLTSIVDLLTVGLYTTLWSFIGVLILPTLSKAGVFYGDSFIPKNQLSLWSEIITQLDQCQDEEPSRSETIEAIFHPLPSVNRRMARLTEGTTNLPDLAHWHIARNTLYLNWALLGILSRSVHCNVGRPELWVCLPAE